MSEDVWDVQNMLKVAATTHYSSAGCGRDSLLRSLQHALLHRRSNPPTTM